MLHHRDRKKTLGQFFTGQRVGRLLAALAGADSARTIIDPMVGAADLLTSCLAVGALPDRLVGFDLDHLAVAQANAALDGIAAAEVVRRDAFAGPLPQEQFDLVITNPPYIRYQSRGDDHDVTPPTMTAVRASLLSALEQRSGLDTGGRALMMKAARDFPSTADIAVPAWILSASLVRVGGILAVVVPQTWLSRNYAHAVRTLLHEAFDVECIVEDGDATWFSDALVRTHLVIARRRATNTPPQPTKVLARATRELERNGLLTGGLPDEAAVVAALRAVSSTKPVEVTSGLTARVVSNGAPNPPHPHAVRVPERIAAYLGEPVRDLVTDSISSLGWDVGQGLRTGANDFFYVEMNGDLARPAKRWGRERVAIPADCLIPVVRRQSDIRGVTDVHDAEMLPARLVYLRDWTTEADSREAGDALDVRVLPASAQEWVEQVASTPLLPAQPHRLFPHLTAVAPNVRFGPDGRPTSFWYQLPTLAPRHRPEVFMPRVCGGRTAAYANTARAVVDANFASLWRRAPDAVPVDAMLALLTSDWVAAVLESSCTVLGGGALKVEATDLRRLPLPSLAPDEIAQLEDLGRKWRRGPESTVKDEIDGLIAAAISSAYPNVDVRETLRDLARISLDERSA